MPKVVTLPAYAKLNLALRIIGRRPDGFHNLQTLFERIDLCDELTFTESSGTGIRIRCDNPALPVDGRNLVFKAARLLQEACKIRKGLRIEITKRIPVAAGLAGGSSDAAVTLMGLNKLWRLGFSNRELVPFARKLGSDVAFFLYDIPWALGTGRGDIIEPVDIPGKLCHLLITPKVSVLARDVYKTYAALFSNRARRKRAGGDFSLTKPDDAVTILFCSLRKSDIIRAGKRLFNDLEPSILALRPGLLKLKERLQKSPVLGVSFSGSGPSIFALTATSGEAERLREKFSRTYQQVYVVQTRN